MTILGPTTTVSRKREGTRCGHGRRSCVLRLGGQGRGRGQIRKLAGKNDTLDCTTSEQSNLHYTTQRWISIGRELTQLAGDDLAQR